MTLPASLSPFIHSALGEMNDFFGETGKSYMGRVTPSLGSNLPMESMVSPLLLHTVDLYVV